MPLIVLGVAIGVATLGFVHQVNLFGATCFYVGELRPNTACFAPVLYYGVLGIAVLLVLFGAVRLMRKTSTPSS